VRLCRSMEAMKLNELKDKLEVASLQKRILSAIPPSVSGGETSLFGGQYHSLANKLLSVSDLFNDYAAPMGMYEICLLIMNMCKTNDPNTIRALWNCIISRELQDVRSEREDVQDFIRSLKEGTPLEDSIADTYGWEFESGEWIRPLKDKITSLGRELWDKGAAYTFPLQAIVPILEGV